VRLCLPRKGCRRFAFGALRRHRCSTSPQTTERRAANGRAAPHRTACRWRRLSRPLQGFGRAIRIELRVGGGSRSLARPRSRLLQARRLAASAHSRWWTRPQRAVQLALGRPLLRAGVATALRLGPALPPVAAAAGKHTALLCGFARRRRSPDRH